MKNIFQTLCWNCNQSNHSVDLKKNGEKDLNVWRSRRGYRQLFGIRENPHFNEQFFDQEKFTEQFLHQFNQKPLQRGQHVFIVSSLVFLIENLFVRFRSNVKTWSSLSNSSNVNSFRKKNIWRQSSLSVKSWKIWAISSYTSWIFTARFSIESNFKRKQIQSAGFHSFGIWFFTYFVCLGNFSGKVAHWKWRGLLVRTCFFSKK